MLNQCVSRLISVSGFSLSCFYPFSLRYSSLINFMMRKVNCRRIQPCPLNIPRVFTFHTITMQKQSTEHALLTNKNIFVSSRSIRACFKDNLELQTATEQPIKSISEQKIIQPKSLKDWERTKKWQIYDDRNCLLSVGSCLSVTAMLTIPSVPLCILSH